MLLNVFSLHSSMTEHETTTSMMQLGDPIPELNDKIKHRSLLETACGTGEDVIWLKVWSSSYPLAQPCHQFPAA